MGVEACLDWSPQWLTVGRDESYWCVDARVSPIPHDEIARWRVYSAVKHWTVPQHPGVMYRTRVTDEHIQEFASAVTDCLKLDAVNSFLFR